MTVAELIERLSGFPQKATVVVDRHSDYGDVTDIDGLTLIPKGDWYIHPRYQQLTDPPQQYCVYITNR